MNFQDNTGEQEKIERAGVLEYLMVGRVRPVGQVGHDTWYAVCHATTIKPAGLARAGNLVNWYKKPPSGGHKPRQRRPHNNYLTHVARQRNDMRHSSRRHPAKQKTAVRRS